MLKLNSILCNTYSYFSWEFSVVYGCIVFIIFAKFGFSCLQIATSVVEWSLFSTWCDVGLFCFFFFLYFFPIFSLILLKPIPHAQQQGNNNDRRRGVHQEEVTVGGIKFHHHPCRALISSTPFSDLGGLTHFESLGAFD